MVEKTAMRVTVIGKTGKVEKVVQSTVGGSSKQNETAEGSSGGNKSFGRTTIYSSSGTNKTAQETQQESQQAIQQYEAKQQEAKRVYDQVAKLRTSGQDVRPAYEEASRRGYNISEQVGNDIYFYKGSRQSSRSNPQLIAQVEGERANTTKNLKRITNAGAEKERALQEAQKTGVGIIEDRGFPIQRKTIAQTEQALVRLPFGAIGSKVDGGFIYENKVNQATVISSQESPTGLATIRNGKVVPVDVVKSNLPIGGGKQRNDQYIFAEYKDLSIKGNENNFERGRFLQGSDILDKTINFGIDFSTKANEFIQGKVSNVVSKIENKPKTGFNFLDKQVTRGIGIISDITLGVPSRTEDFLIKTKYGGFSGTTTEEKINTGFDVILLGGSLAKGVVRIGKGVGSILLEGTTLAETRLAKRLFYTTDFAKAEELALKETKVLSTTGKIVTGGAKVLTKYPLEFAFLGYAGYQVSKADDKLQATIDIIPTIIGYELLGRVGSTIARPINRVTKFERVGLETNRIDEFSIFKETAEGKITSGQLRAKETTVFENRLGQRIITKKEGIGTFIGKDLRTDVELSLTENTNLFSSRKSKPRLQSERIGRVSTELNIKEINNKGRGDTYIDETLVQGYGRGGIKYAKGKKIDIFELFSEQKAKARETSFIRVDETTKLTENIYGKRKLITAKDVTGREVFLTKPSILKKDSLNAFDIVQRNKPKVEGSLLDRTKTNKIDALFLDEKLITSKNNYLFFGKAETVTNELTGSGFSKSSIRDFSGELTNIEKHNKIRAKVKARKDTIDRIKSRLKLNKKGEIQTGFGNRGSETGFEILTKEKIEPKPQINQQLKFEVAERVKTRNKTNEILMKNEIKNAFNLFDRPSLPKTRNRYMGISRERVGIGENTKIKSQLDNLLKTGSTTRLDTGALTKLETGTLTTTDTGQLYRTGTIPRTRTPTTSTPKIEGGVPFIPIIPSLDLGMGYTPKYGKGGVSRRRGKKTYIADYTSAILGLSKKATGRELDTIYSGLELRRVLR